MRTQRGQPAGKGRAPLGASLVVISSLIYASYGIWIVLMGDFFDSFSQAVLRSGLVVLLLLPLVIKRKELKRVRWRRDGWWLFGLLASSALIAAPLYYAVLRVGMGLATGVTYAGIILGAFFFGWLLARERYTKDKWLSTILGVAGLWLVFAPQVDSAALLPMTAALVGGLSAGLNMVITKKIPYGAMQTTLLMWAATALSNLPFVFLLQERLPSVGWDVNWLYLLFFTAASLLASWALIAGLKRIEAGAAGILGLLEIVFGIAYGVVLFQERPGGLALAGMGVIIVAAAIPYVQHYVDRKSALD